MSQSEIVIHNSSPKVYPIKKIEVQIHKLCTEVELLNLKVSKQSCNSSFEKSIIKGSKIGVKLCLGTENKPIEYGLSPHVDDVRVEENVVASTDSNMQHTHTEVDNVLLNLTPSISEGTALEKSALSHHQDSSSLTQQELACITAVSHQTRNNHDGATVSPDGQGDDGHVTDCSRATSDQSLRIDAHLHAPEAYKEVNVTSEKVSSSAEPKQPTSTSNNHCGATILADGQGNDRRVIGARSYQNVISDAHTQSIEPYKKDSLTSESVSSLAEPELHSKHVNKINVVCSPPRNNLSAESNRISVINCRSTNFKGSELNRKLHIPNEQERVNQQPVRKKGKHTSGNPCNSEISSKDLRLSGSLKQYMPIRSSAHQYKCEHCDKCFSRKHHVLDHMTIHTGERPHECETCGKCFTQKTHLNRHMTIHIGVKPYKCEKCGMRFIVRDKLNIHMRNHTGEKPYKCETCGRCYAQKSSLTYHMRIHTGKKPYKCEYCEKCFSHKHHAIEHMTIHTGERPYKCDTCGKCFRQKSTCRVHERGHIGDKLYKCETCGASFGIRDDFKSHKLIHPDVKPFKCDTCGRCFKLKSNLKCHMRIHTGEKPYKCETCGISFSLKCNLKRHMKKQHM